MKGQGISHLHFSPLGKAVKFLFSSDTQIFHPFYSIPLYSILFYSIPSGAKGLEGSYLLFQESQEGQEDYLIAPLRPCWKAVLRPG